MNDEILAAIDASLHRTKGLSKLWVVLNNWRDDCDVALFKSEKSALKCFAGGFLEQQDPDAEYAEVTKACLRAIGERQFTYPGPGKEPKRFVSVFSLEVQP